MLLILWKSDPKIEVEMWKKCMENCHLRRQKKTIIDRHRHLRFLGRFHLRSSGSSLRRIRYCRNSPM